MKVSRLKGVHFFGGTMWTNFNNADYRAMLTAQSQMNDFRLIYLSEGQVLRPIDTIALHNQFIDKLLAWFKSDLVGPRIVISHHAPVVNPNTQYLNSPLMPAFNSVDMQGIIDLYQPFLWVYGHTHECDDHMVGLTRVISNQLGYPNRANGYECADFEKNGFPIIIEV